MACLIKSVFNKHKTTGFTTYRVPLSKTQLFPLPLTEGGLRDLFMETLVEMVLFKRPAEISSLCEGG